MNESDYVSPGPGSASGRALTEGGDSGKAGSRPPQAPFEVSQEPLLPAGEAPEPPMGTYSPAPAYEHLGDLPPTYGSQSVYLVAYDPRQLFAYWDVDPGNARHMTYGLRVCRGDGEVESEVPINPREAGRYLAAGVPGGTYYVELGTTGRAGRWRPLGFSARVTMPAGGLAGEVEPKFATLPFHLSFQRLLELIEDAMGQGEDLTAALARLQGGDKTGLDALLGSLASLSQEQLHVLERLLGHQIHPRTDAGSSFAGASENSVLGVGAVGAAGGSETLSSGAFVGGAVSSGAFGSETLSSQGSASEQRITPVAAAGEAFSSGGAVLGSETLASGAAAAFGSETLPSGAVGLGSETLASGAAGLGSETLAAGAAGLGSETLAAGAAGLGSETLAAGAAGLGSETLASGAAGLGSETLASGAAGLGSETLAAGAVGLGSETLASGAIGFGSETLASGELGFGSETLASGELGFGSGTLSSLGLTESSAEILRGLGINSEAFASGGASLTSEMLSSDRMAMFFHTLENNLSSLSSLFSEAAASLSSEFLSSELSSSGSGSS
jgi:hypothetical protein